jgi:pullulanase/glycogen debranching enzyme
MTATIPDSLLPNELKGTQGTLACLRAPYVIDHLKRLNITTIEVMPIQNAGDEWSVYSAGRENVWKYMPASFFAVHPGYCHAKDAIGQRDELIATVDAYHAAGIEFIIDFVGGHTFEGAKNRPGDGRDLSRIKGPTISLRGLADSQFYHVDGQGNYVDATACEHTVNVNNPLASGLLLRARDYWLDEIGLAGLRIDQASIFGRREYSLMFDPSHPFLREFARADRLFIAEPCDAWGFFSGEFRHSGAWKEQIFRDRDITRAFFAAEQRDPHYRSENIVGRLASSVSGYSDVFTNGENLGVRFADCHDGMNVWDQTAEMLQQLVRQKILTIDTFLQPEKVIEARVALARAMHASVMFSPGPYMLSRGAEVLRSQGGLHNPFDRPEYKGITWEFSDRGMDLERKDFQSFMESASQLRADLRVFNITQHYKGNGGVRWFNREGTLVQAGTKNDNEGRRIAWESQQRFLAALYPGFPFKKGEESPSSVYVVRTGSPADFKLPKLDDYHVWVREIDTSLNDAAKGEVVDSNKIYHVSYPSVCVFTLKLKSALQ